MNYCQLFRRPSVKILNLFTISFKSIPISSSSPSSKSKFDNSAVPTLDEGDLEEQFVRGSGPGGQVVNKTSNCVQLRHKPTGLLVKCHAHRQLSENRKEARRLLTIKLDNLINGDKSMEQQELHAQKQRSAEQIRRRRKLDDMKQKWREREREFLENDK